MSFDGESDYVSGSFSGGDIFSISGWVKTTESELNGIVGYTNSSGNRRELYLFANGYPRIFYGTNAYKTATISFNDGEWHHIVATYDGATPQIYVDNAIQTLSEELTASAVTGNIFQIGYVLSGGTSYFNGSLADVRIYNRALTTDEINSLYETYRPKLSAGSLEKGKVLDLPLSSKYYNPGTDVLTDRTPYMNNGANNGAEVGADSTTFVAANGDTIRIADDDSLDNASTMSAFAWVKGAGQNNKGILNKHDWSANKRSFRISSSVSSPYQKMRIYISDDGTLGANHIKDYISSIDILDESWHLAGFTFNAGTLKLYIDGVEDTSVSKPLDDAITTIFTSDRDVMIGSYLSNDTPTGYFNGDISHTKIYNRALSDEEILLMFERGRHA